MSNSKFRRHVVSRGAQCPEDDMERNVGESKLFKGVQVICSITALKLKVDSHEVEPEERRKVL